MYVITATVAKKTTDTSGTEWTSTRQIPTFYLDPTVQGILTEQGAIEIAKMIIDPFGEYEVNATAVNLDPKKCEEWCVLKYSSHRGSCVRAGC